MNKRLVVYLSLYFAIFLPQLWGQKSYYPLAYEGDKAVVTGFVSFNIMDDENIFTNTYLWVLDNICSVGKDEIKEMSIQNKSLKFNTIISSLESSTITNVYHISVSLKILEGKLIFYLDDIWFEQGLMKKNTSLNSLKPDSKSKHKEIIEDFVKSESSFLNKLFAFVDNNFSKPITHWKEIANENVVKGMNEDEVRLAIGKPRIVVDSDTEVQWMYSSSYYVFFKDDKVSLIMK